MRLSTRYLVSIVEGRGPVGDELSSLQDRGSLCLLYLSLSHSVSSMPCPVANGAL